MLKSKKGNDRIAFRRRLKGASCDFKKKSEYEFFLYVLIQLLRIQASECLNGCFSLTVPGLQETIEK